LTLAPSGLPIAGFRMCSTERRFDREAGTWVDGHTNWYSVSMFRQLATNGAASIRKGDRVVIFGRLKVRPWSKDDGRHGTSVEIDAETAGHDLMWGTAAFRRSSAEKMEKGEDQEPGMAEEVPDGVDPETGQILEPTGSTEGPRTTGAGRQPVKDRDKDREGPNGHREGGRNGQETLPDGPEATGSVAQAGAGGSRATAPPGRPTGAVRADAMETPVASGGAPF
jgi:single-strand DNA-binding protein